MADKLEAIAIEAGSITEQQMNTSTWSQVYGALAAANAAYNRANSSIANTGDANLTGNYAITNGKLFIGISNSNSALHVVGTTTLGEVVERINVSANVFSGNLNFDVLTQPILYLTGNATANGNINFRGNSTVSMNTVLSVGHSITVTLMVTNGGTTYKVDGVSVDGVVQSTKWAGAAAPSVGGSYGVDMYTFTILKTGSAAYTVFGAQQKYG